MNIGKKISVIVITYNHEPYIKQALDSILMQELPFSWELLIGDDASTDRTAMILKEYEKRYPDKIKLYLRKENIGASKNLYELLSHAMGDYIALLEGDDYWTDYNKLKKQVEFLESHSLFSACTHDCIITDLEGMENKNQKLIWLCKKQVFTLEDCKGFYLSGQTGTLVFRNFLKQSEKDYSIIYHAHPMISDRTIQTILTAIAPIYHINEKMSAYRYNVLASGANATAKLFVDHAETPLENLNLTFALEDYLKEEFGITLSCRQVKHMFFATAVMKWMVHPSRQTRDIVWQMITHKKVRKAEYLLALPIEALRRLRYRLERNK